LAKERTPFAKALCTTYTLLKVRRWELLYWSDEKFKKKV